LDKGSQKSISKFWEVLRPMNDSTKITGIGVSSSNNNTRTSGQLLIHCGGAWKFTTNHHDVRTNYTFRPIQGTLYGLEATVVFC
jgi:hypothetical protein